MEKIRRVTKFKFNGKRVTVEYGLYKPEGDEEPDILKMDLRDMPTPDCVEALKALAGDVLSICELDGVKSTLIDVVGVSFSWANDIMGATITALMKLRKSNAPLVLNTPHKPSEAYAEGGDDGNVLDDGTIDRLNELLAEIERYIDGERAQGNLFEKQNDDSVVVKCIVCGIEHPLREKYVINPYDEKCYRLDVFEKAHRTKLIKHAKENNGLIGEHVCGKCYLKVV